MRSTGLMVGKLKIYNDMGKKFWVFSLIYLMISMSAILVYLDVNIIKHYDNSFWWWLFMVLFLMPFHLLTITLFYTGIDNIRKGKID